MSGGYRVLLVDDNDLNRTLARTILTRSTHPITAMITLVEADTLAAARTALAAAPVDLILLDMQLPDGHGTTLATELATHNNRPAIIAVTASVLPEEQQSVLAAGCDDFLAKPYLPQQLIDIIAVHLTPPTDI
ncbi:response regulator [Actinoplanes sp. NPDC051475]|uniref:response regulator n=1 Tax=Actinoplanes sp. NPDC051475 TaxID=3157225 RepID=UPI00344D181C